MVQPYCYDGHSDGEKNGPDLEDGVYRLMKHLPQLRPLHGLPSGQWVYHPLTGRDGLLLQSQRVLRSLRVQVLECTQLEIPILRTLSRAPLLP